MRCYDPRNNDARIEITTVSFGSHGRILKTTETSNRPWRSTSRLAMRRFESPTSVRRFLAPPCCSNVTLSQDWFPPFTRSLRLFRSARYSAASSIRDNAIGPREYVSVSPIDGTLANDGVAGATTTIAERGNETRANCTPHSIEEFPNDLFTPEQRRQGAVILHTFFGFYCFLLTAFVCNDYLLPALDLICMRMKISGDVAGATFLATASCFPELFVNVVGTFLTESDLGVGTVMGSAVFNTFATPACGALSAVRVSILCVKSAGGEKKSWMSFPDIQGFSGGISRFFVYEDCRLSIGSVKKFSLAFESGVTALRSTETNCLRRSSNRTSAKDRRQRSLGWWIIRFHWTQ